MAYKRIHNDDNFNFQMNRVLSYGDAACSEKEIFEISNNIISFDSWYEQWNKYAILARRDKRYMHSMYYYRMAEFFLDDSDNRKDEAYYNMLEMFKLAQPDAVKIQVKFKNGFLPTLQLFGKDKKGTILIHGGYDSFIEEFYLVGKKFFDDGYNVILYEGEGQGATLRSSMQFNYKWEDSVGSILDHFNINECSLIGISWGGYFALRAAAKEKRIKNVVAYDIMYDGLDTQLNVLGNSKKRIVRTLYKLKFKNTINKLVNKATEESQLASWAVSHGLYITKTNSPYEFYQNIEKHTLKNIEKEVNQNVLLLAGEKDHYIPLEHYHILMKKLTNANVTGRIFLEKEGGEQHCQVGNYDLALNEIRQWLNNLV